MVEAKSPSKPEHVGPVRDRLYMEPPLAERCEAVKEISMQKPTLEIVRRTVASFVSCTPKKAEMRAR
jgi:hypothetical protein